MYHYMMNILFEHEFFIRIAQSFPFMTSLTIINRYGQKDKQCRKLKNENLLKMRLMMITLKKYYLIRKHVYHMMLIFISIINL
jgi:hypothetical protein